MKNPSFSQKYLKNKKTLKKRPKDLEGQTPQTGRVSQLLYE